jgi:hypothetical protein
MVILKRILRVIQWQGQAMAGKQKSELIPDSSQQQEEDWVNLI